MSAVVCGMLRFVGGDASNPQCRETLAFIKEELLRDERCLMKKLDCFRAFRLSKRLTLGGTFAILLACSGEWTGLGGPPAAALAVLGAGAIAGAAWVDIRYRVCPSCGRYISDWRRWPSRIPDCCPHCGAPLISPKE